MKIIIFLLLSVSFSYSQICEIKTEITHIKLKKDLDSWLPFSQKSELYFDIYFEGDEGNKTYTDFVVFDEDINKEMKVQNLVVKKKIDDSRPSEVERFYVNINEYDLRNDLDIMEGFNPYSDSGSVLYKRYITVWKYANWRKKSNNEWIKSDILKNNKIEISLISHKKCL